MSKKINAILQKNFSTIKNYYPMYLEKIKDMDFKGHQYIIESTKEKYNTIKILKDNKYIYLHSKYYPVTEANEWINKNMNEQSEIHIFFGFGNGYYIMSLLDKISKNNKVVIFEPDINIFKMAIQNTDLESIFINRNVFIVLEDFSTLKDILATTIGYNIINKIYTYVLPNYSILFHNQLERFYKEVNDLIVSKVISLNTAHYFAQMWQENLLKNMVYLFDSILVSEFKQKLNNIPVIIVSAGPSLNKNVSDLKSVKGRAVIICVGRALKVLLNEGIKPDIIATLDGEDVCLQQFEGLDYSDITLLYSLRVYPKILENHKGKKILFPNFEPIIDLIFERLGVNYFNIPCGSSVATMAFSYACFTGASPIVFVGQDLAYKGTETHAKGTYYGNNYDVDITKQFYKKVTGINGEELATGYDLYTFLRWFEDAISKCNTGQIFINATEGGANIKGTSIMTLSQVINKYCDNRELVKPIIESIYNNRVKYDEILIIECIDNLEQLSNNLDEIIHICKKALRYNDELYKIYKFNTGKDVKQIVEKLNELDDKLRSKREEFALLDNILRPIYDEVILKKKPINDTSEMEKGLFAADMGKSFYEKTYKQIQITKPLLIELINELKIKYPTKMEVYKNGPTTVGGN